MNKEGVPELNKNLKKDKLMTPGDQYEIDFENDVNKQIEERDLNGRTREEAAIFYRYGNPEKLLFNKEIGKWMKDGITLEQWDEDMKRLEEPSDDDYLYGRK